MTTKPLPVELVRAINERLERALNNGSGFTFEEEAMIKLGAEMLYQTMSATHVPKSKVMRLVSLLQCEDRVPTSAKYFGPTTYRPCGECETCKAIAEFEAETNGGKG